MLTEIRLPIRLDGGSAYMKVARRIGFARFPGVSDLVELFELVAPERAKYSELMRGYEAALAEFEGRRFRDAARILGDLLRRYPDDGPARQIFNRAVRGIIERPAWSDTAWDVPQL